MRKWVFAFLVALAVIGSSQAQTCVSSSCPVGTGITVISDASIRGLPGTGGAAGTPLAVIKAGTAGKVMSLPIAAANTTFQWVLVAIGGTTTCSTTSIPSGTCGYLGTDNLKPGSSPPPPPPPPPPTALAGFACTPTFLKVQMSSFVPSGAQGLSFSILNQGTTTLTITAAAVPQPFELSGATFPLNIAAGSSYTMTIKFVPTVAGKYTGNVVFSANVTGGTFQMGVNGDSQ